MDKNPLLYIPPHVPEEQKRTILLKKDEETHFIYVYNIVLVTVNDHYCTLYMVDLLKPECTSVLTIYSSLQAMHHKLGKYFAKPNQSQVFNSIYLKKLTHKRYVHLHYPTNLPEITISRDNYNEFIASLDNTGV